MAKNTDMSQAELLWRLFGTDDLMEFFGTDDPVEILARVDPAQISGTNPGGAVASFEINDFDRHGNEVTNLRAIVQWAKGTRKVEEKQMRSGSLRYLAAKLGKTERQVREYWDRGLIPGAYRTPRGQRRIRYQKDTVAKTSAVIGKFGRQRTEARFHQFIRQYFKAAAPFYPDEACFPTEKMAKMNLGQYEVLLGVAILQQGKKVLSAKSLAKFVGITVKTLRKRLPRKLLKATLCAGSPLIDKFNDNLNENLNGLVVTKSFGESAY